MAKQSTEVPAPVETNNLETVEQPKPRRAKAKSGTSNEFVLCDVIQLEKKLTGEKSANGTVLFDLVEGKKLKQVKILREHLGVHAEQEPNTLKRYKEA